MDKVTFTKRNGVEYVEDTLDYVIRDGLLILDPNSRRETRIFTLKDVDKVTILKDYDNAMGSHNDSPQIQKKEEVKKA